MPPSYGESVITPHERTADRIKLMMQSSAREDRYTQQQRLRTAIAHHGKQHKEEADARHAHLTQGDPSGGLNWRRATSRANHQHHCAADRANQRAQGNAVAL